MDHSHDDDHTHDHGGGHTHDHGHSHDHTRAHGDGEYYLNQLLIVFICGVFGVVAVLLYQTLGNSDTGGMMGKLLAPPFQPPVLLGGIVLLVLVVVRGVLLWGSAGDPHAGHDHGQSNDHGHSHDHKHDEPGHVHDENCKHDDHKHDHGHSHADHSAEDHEHGNTYWRVVVLGIPIFLFLMGVPSRGFSARWIKEYLGEEEALKISDKKVAETGKELVFSFQQLNDMSKRPESRQSLIGSRTTLTGQFAPVSGREFSLVFLNMTCCPADKEPLRARILAQDASQIAPYTRTQYPWVSVSGIITEFVQSPKTGEFITIIRVDKPDGVQPAEPKN